MSPTSCRRVAASILAAALSMSAGSLHAQSAASLGIAAGATLPVSSYGDDKDLGYHLGLVLDVRLPTSMFGFRVDGTFTEMKYSSNSTKDQIWSATFNALLKVPSTTTIAPYVIGGAGIYNRHRTLFLGNNATTNPGLNVGGGFRFHLTEMTAFLEARYHRVSGDNGIQIVPISFGIVF
jgi:hypothetical protein